MAPATSTPPGHTARNPDPISPRSLRLYTAHRHAGSVPAAGTLCRPLSRRISVSKAREGLYLTVLASARTGPHGRKGPSQRSCLAPWGRDRASRRPALSICRKRSGTLGRRTALDRGGICTTTGCKNDNDTKQTGRHAGPERRLNATYVMAVERSAQRPGNCSYFQ